MSKSFIVLINLCCFFWPLIAFGSAIPLWHHENDYPADYRFQILVDAPIVSEVQEKDFFSISHIVHALYADDYKKQGIQVSITHDWQKPYFSAYAKKIVKNHFSINFWGGFARIPSMTSDAWALVACHELGHILGGEPKTKIERLSWSSSEGQSDYFSTGECLKRYLELVTKPYDHQTIESSTGAYTLCKMQYRDQLDFSICLKSMNASRAFANVLNYLAEDDLEPSIDSPSLQQVDQTLFNSYPEVQCRLDTLVQGTLCPKEEFPCQKNMGQRPGCWFNGL